MELSRRKTLGALGLAAVVTALPASAAMAGVRPEIINAGGSPTPEGGAWVFVRCTVPVVLVTGRLYNSAQTVELGSYELTLTEGHTPLYGVWNGPPLTGVPLGNHWVVYEATSADGLVATAARLFFIWRAPIFTCTVQPDAIDDDHRVVDIRGTLMAEHPISHEVTPVAGMRLKAFAWYTEPPPGEPQFTEVFTTTGADGGFSTRMTLARPGTIAVGTEGLPHDSLVNTGGTGPMPISVVTWQTRISLKLDAEAVDEGKSATADGRLEVLRDGEWRPLAARKIDLVFIEASSGYASPVNGPPPTDAQGRFRVEVSPPSHGSYVATFTSPDPFYASASAASDGVSVRAPARFSDSYFKVQRTAIELDDPWRYELTGIVYTAQNPRIQMQYRPDPAGAWQTLSTTVPDDVYHEGGWMFTGAFTMPGSGEIRAYIAQSDTIQATASKIVTILVMPRVPTRPQTGDDAGPRPQRPPFS